MAVLGRGQCKGPESGISLASDKDPIRAEILGAQIFPGTHSSLAQFAGTKERRRKGKRGRR